MSRPSSASQFQGALGLTDVAGNSWSAFTPAAGSVLIDSGLDLVDRIAGPGRFFGAAADRGAVEVPP